MYGAAPGLLLFYVRRDGAVFGLIAAHFNHCYRLNQVWLVTPSFIIVGDPKRGELGRMRSYIHEPSE